MNPNGNTGAAIVAVEFAVPARVLDNEQLAAEFTDWTAEKIFAKTGIRTRHVAGENEFASDLAVQAARSHVTIEEDHHDHQGRRHIAQHHLPRHDGGRTEAENHR